MAVTWSLAIEEQFYLTIPLIVRKLSRRQLTWALTGVVVGAPLLRAFLLITFQPHGGFADYVLMPCRADALSLGVLSAIWYRSPRAWSLLLSRRLWLYGVATGLLLGLGWMAFRQYNYSASPMATYGYSLLALFYTCCLLIALMKTPTSQRLLRTRWLIELGGIAYCVYLLHIPLMVVGRSIVATYFPFLRSIPLPHALGIEALTGGLVGVVLTLIVAKLSWRFFEQPLLRHGHAYRY
jgi:peptidoglycan/LPS O-acetylase OafA/YrhL